VGGDGGTARREVAGRMAAAARAWLDALPGAQRGIAQRGRPRSGSPAEDDRQRWHYTPVDHGGLTFAAMGAHQRSLAMQLVATGPSAGGYVTVCTVMGLENVLDRIEQFPPVRGGERLRDPARYYLRVFGEPGSHAPWGWRLGGHHVSLNNLVVDDRVAAVTPNFLGANPASAPLLGGAALRPLGATEDLARELVRSLPRAARDRAVLLDRAPSDIVSGERPRLPGDGEVAHADEPADSRLDLRTVPVGLPGSDLDAGQRELLGRLLAAYTGRVPEGLCPTRTSTRCTSPGPGRWSRGARTTTGCRARACSSSGTTRRTTPTMRTRCGATPTATSGGTRSPSTAPSTTPPDRAVRPGTGVTHGAPVTSAHPCALPWR
jgi:hypothetical protein